MLILILLYFSGVYFHPLLQTLLLHLQQLVLLYQLLQLRSCFFILLGDLFRPWIQSHRLDSHPVLNVNVLPLQLRRPINRLIDQVTIELQDRRFVLHRRTAPLLVSLLIIPLSNDLRLRLISACLRTAPKTLSNLTLALLPIFTLYIYRRPILVHLYCRLLVYGRLLYLRLNAIRDLQRT